MIMLIKAALRSIRKNLLMNFFILLEMIAAISLSVIMTSSFMIRYRYYEPFKQELSSTGMFCEFGGMANKNAFVEGIGNGIIHDDEILAELNGAQSVLSCNLVETYFEKDGQKAEALCFSYNDEVIKRFTPQLEIGRYLAVSDQADCIEAVITGDAYGWSVGDEIDVDFCLSEPLKVKIVGKLADKAKVFGGNSSFTGKDNYNIMFASTENDNDFPILLFSSESLDKFCPEGERITQGLKTAIINYPDNTDYSVIQEDQIKLDTFGRPYTIQLDVFNKNSIEYMSSEIYNLLPIIIVILIMIFVSSISSTALSSYQQLREYAVYYIVGLRWSQCVYINLIKSCLLSAVSAALSAVILVVLPLTGLADSVTVIPGAFVFASALFVIIAYIAVSMIMPAAIFHKNTPKQILTR